MFWRPRRDRDDPESTVGRRPFRFWREPLIHFFVLGLVVFGLRGVLEDKQASADDPLLAPVRFERSRKILRAKAGRCVTQMHYARQGIVTPEMEMSLAVHLRVPPPL